MAVRVKARRGKAAVGAEAPAKPKAAKPAAKLITAKAATKTRATKAPAKRAAAKPAAKPKAAVKLKTGRTAVKVATKVVKAAAKPKAKVAVKTPKLAAPAKIGKARAKAGAKVAKAPTRAAAKTIKTPVRTKLSKPLARARAKAAKTTLRDVPFKVTNPERIPAQRYYDQEFYDLECKYLWPKVWQMAARLEEIPQVGDWVEYKILDKSVIVVRTKSGVKAFHNACRHRGVLLAAGHGNCETTGFICPFHGWRFDMNGKNTFVFNRQIFSPEQLDQAELNLKPCRLEEWGGCAFINFDDEAAPLLDCIKPFADMHDPRKVENLKVEWWLACDLPTNWKLAMEAFQEGYHVMRTHPQLHAVHIPNDGPHSYQDPALGKQRTFASGKEFAEAFIANMKVLGEGMGGMIVETDIAVAERIVDEVALSDDIRTAAGQWMFALNDAITKDARERKIDMPDLNEIGPVGPDNFCFPHYFLLPQYGNMSSYRIRPLGPERCLFELYSLRFYPEGTERPIPRAPEPMAPDDPRWPPIPIQDFSNLPKPQLGLHAEGFEYMRLSHAKEGLISNNHRVIDGFLAGVDKAKLVRGMQIACTPLDEAIHDLGF